MNRDQEWSEFLNNLLTCAEKTYQSTAEHEYLEQRHAAMDGLLETTLPEDQRELVEEVLFARGLDADRAAQRLYRQGVTDGVWLLKQLGYSRSWTTASALTIMW